MSNLPFEKVLVTGGTGHLGTALIHHLVRKGLSPQNIRVLYLAGTPTEGLADLPGVELVAGNVLSESDVKGALQGVTHVFHMVGNTTFDPFKKKGQWLVNVEGTRNVLEACLNVPSIQKIVYTSTVNTLGVPSPVGSLGTEETSPYTSSPRMHSFDSPVAILRFADDVHAGTAPANWVKRIGIGYFDSKLAAQEIVTRFYKDHRLPVVSVLPGTNFGPYDNMVGSGMYLLRVYHNAMPGYTAGGGFPLTHVCDQAEGHLLAMTKGKPGERYIITGRAEDNMPMGDMLRTIAEVLREKEPSKRINVPSKEIPTSVAKFGAALYELYAKLFKKPCLLSRDAVRAGSFLSFYSYAKAERELGFVPKRTFRQAIGDMFDYYKAHDLLHVRERLADKLK
ncbi:MAG: NAD-dependent epimerase/dehydratase family protein [Candidatus Sigynarchaeum springense]